MRPAAGKAGLPIFLTSGITAALFHGNLVTICPDIFSQVNGVNYHLHDSQKEICIISLPFHFSPISLSSVVLE